MHCARTQLRSFATVLLSGAVLGTTACGGAISPAKAKAGTVAEAAGGSLSGAKLDAWLMHSPMAPNRPEAAVVLSAWINTALVIDAIRKNQPLADSATTQLAITPDADRGVAVRYFAGRDAQQPLPNDRQADSLLDIDRVRVFQQIVFRVKPNDDSLTVVAIANRARAAYSKIHAGMEFTAAVRQFSDDTAARSNNGFLPAVVKEDVPERLSSIWRLRPNDIAPLMPSGVGFHIIRRATREESRGGIKNWLRPVLAHRADSIFIDSVVRSRALQIAPDARLRIRAIATEPGVVPDGPALATWKGGELSLPKTRMMIAMMTPAERFQLTDASDSALTAFVQDLSRREIMMPVISPDQTPVAKGWSVLAPAYARAIDSIRAAVNRMPASLSPADAATAFIDSVFAARRPYMPLPGALSDVLRARAKPTVNQAAVLGVLQGVAVEWQEAHKNDSTVQQKRAAAATNRAAPPKHP